MMLSELPERVLKEFIYFMTGDKLGGGSTRQVYHHPFDKDKVIKIENSTTEFQNVMEWEFWNDWKHDKDVVKWLAPCYAISDSGTFLIMAKTEPLKKVPLSLPTFLTDHKPANYGLYKGRVVCHDYGKVIRNLTMKQRKWTGEKI